MRSSDIFIIDCLLISVTYTNHCQQVKTDTL